MKYNQIVNKMKNNGIVFANGLTEKEFEEIEKIYNIKFPKDLKEFLSIGLPFAQYTSIPKIAGQPEYYHYNKPFPIWNDFSEENIKAIKEWIAKPKQLLKEEYIDSKNNESEFIILLNDLGINNDKSIEEIDKEFEYFLVNKLETTIPVFAHRYILEKESSPVLSIPQTDDIVLYGDNLFNYLEREFCGKKITRHYELVNLGYWHEVVVR